MENEDYIEYKPPLPDFDYSVNPIDPIAYKRTYFSTPEVHGDLDDSSKRTTFFTCDGKVVETMEDVMLYNQLFLESMTNNHIAEDGEMHK